MRTRSKFWQSNAIENLSNTYTRSIVVMRSRVVKLVKVSIARRATSIVVINVNAEMYKVE
jgi:hypothetical protein